jgi:hypothetical protein
MIYNLFSGGNIIREAEDTLFSYYSEDYPVKPASHHKPRKLVLEAHLDTQSRVMLGHYEGLGSKIAEFVPVTGDVLLPFLLPRGGAVASIGVHVKRAGAGIITPALTVLSATGGAPTVVPLFEQDGTAASVDLSVPGFYRFFPTADFTVNDSSPTAIGTVTLPADYLVSTGGYVRYDITQANDGVNDLPFDGCYGMYLEVTDFFDEHHCECAPKACPAVFPDPVCNPE